MAYDFLLAASILTLVRGIAAGEACYSPLKGQGVVFGGNFYLLRSDTLREGRKRDVDMHRLGGKCCRNARLPASTTGNEWCDFFILKIKKNNQKHTAARIR